MSEPPADTLTGSVWGDRVAMVGFVVVFGFTFIPHGLGGGPMRAGPDWRELALAIPSIVFWVLVTTAVAAALGVA